jgi:uncharacterized protein involved in exopolysaccharide biosynthesis
MKKVVPGYTVPGQLVFGRRNEYYPRYSRYKIFAGPGDAYDENEANMKDLTHLDAMGYFQILWKRRWYALVVFILVVSGASIYASFISDMYKSEIRVRADSRFSPQDLIGPPNLTPEDRINWIRRLYSRKFLESMIEQLIMYGYGTHAGFVMENAVKTAQKHIGIKRIPDNTFAISFIASDPQLAQTVTRKLALEFIRVRADAKKYEVLATDEFLAAQLKKTQKDLAAQEEKIKQFKRSHLQLAPSLEQELSVLLREENILKTQYDHLQNLKSRIDMAKAVEPDNNYETYRIIEEASLPVNPEFPSRLQIILMGIGGGLLLGIGAAFGRELPGS